MDLLSTTESAQKMGHLIQLRAALQRAKERGEWVTRANGKRHLAYLPHQAIYIQERERELKEFLSTMRPRLVQ